MQDFNEDLYWNKSIDKEKEMYYTPHTALCFAVVPLLGNWGWVNNGFQMSIYTLTLGFIWRTMKGISEKQSLCFWWGPSVSLLVIRIVSNVNNLYWYTQRCEGIWGRNAAFCSVTEHFLQFSCWNVLVDTLWLCTIYAIDNESIIGK